MTTDEENSKTLARLRKQLFDATTVWTKDKKDRRRSDEIAVGIYEPEIIRLQETIAMMSGEKPWPEVIGTGKSDEGNTDV